MTPEYGVPEAIWPGKELGLPPPLPQEGFQDSPPLQSESNEDDIAIPHIPLLDRALMSFGTLGPEKKAEFLEEKKNLPPDATIELYHGLNGGLAKALAVLESPNQGVRQMSGPCLALYPVGQFWKPGDAGLRYSIPRRLIEFPGENLSDAKFRVDKGGAVTLMNGLETLPLTEFDGEVMRTERKEDVYEERLVGDTWTDVLVGERIVPLEEGEREAGLKIEEEIGRFSQARETAIMDASQIRQLQTSLSENLPK